MREFCADADNLALGFARRIHIYYCNCIIFPKRKVCLTAVAIEFTLLQSVWGISLLGIDQLKSLLPVLIWVLYWRYSVFSQIYFLGWSQQPRKVSTAQ